MRWQGLRRHLGVPAIAYVAASIAALSGFVLGRISAYWPVIDVRVWGTISDWVMIFVTALVAIIAALLPSRIARQERRNQLMPIAKNTDKCLRELLQTLGEVDSKVSQLGLYIISSTLNIPRFATFKENMLGYSPALHHEAAELMERLQFLQSVLDQCIKEIDGVNGLDPSLVNQIYEEYRKSIRSGATFLIDQAIRLQHLLADEFGLQPWKHIQKSS